MCLHTNTIQVLQPSPRQDFRNPWLLTGQSLCPDAGIRAALTSDRQGPGPGVASQPRLTSFSRYPEDALLWPQPKYRPASACHTLSRFGKASFVFQTQQKRIKTGRLGLDTP